MENLNDRAKLFEALAKAQGEFQVARKTAYNPHFKSYFADHEELIRVSRPALSKNGLSVTQALIFQDESHFVETELAHSSGQTKVSVVKINADKNTIQAFGSTVSYIQRYAYKSLLGIATKDDEDDDGEIAMAHPVPVAAPVTVMYITEEQIDILNEELTDHPEIKDNMLLKMGLKSLNQMPKARFQGALARIREIKDTKASK